MKWKLLCSIVRSCHMWSLLSRAVYISPGTDCSVITYFSSTCLHLRTWSTLGGCFLGFSRFYHCTVVILISQSPGLSHAIFYVIVNVQIKVSIRDVSKFGRVYFFLRIWPISLDDYLSFCSSCQRRFRVTFDSFDNRISLLSLSSSSSLLPSSSHHKCKYRYDLSLMIMVAALHSLGRIGQG